MFTSRPRRSRRFRNLAVATVVAIPVLAVLLYELLPSLAPLLSSPMDWTPEPMAGVHTQCFEEEEPEPWTYCLSVAEGSASRDLVYHFHGRRGASTWWNDRDYYSARVHQAWLDDGAEPPKVATISFGPLWLLTENGAGPEGRRLRTFLDHIIPTVERRLEHAVQRRMAVGESMGGVNALLVATKAGTRFDRVAALCAPIYLASPHAGLAELWATVSDAEVSTKRALMLMSFGRYFYPTERSWELDDPLQAVLRGQIDSVPRIYLSCGAQDDWGCMDGSVAFVEGARRRGAHVDWHPRPGGHCDIDAVSVAEFLAESERRGRRGKAPRPFPDLGALPPRGRPWTPWSKF